MEKSSASKYHDLESAVENVHLFNDCIDTFHWNAINVYVHDKSLKRDKYLLEEINGDVAAGRFQFLVVFRKQQDGPLLILFLI